MKKLVLAIITALIVAVTAAPSRAASTVAQSFLLQGAGITDALAYSGQKQCGIQVNSPANGLAATPQYSANGATWFPASSINGGSITAAGTYIDTSGAPPNYIAVRLVVSGTISPQISGQLMCGDNLPPASNGGSSGGVSSVLGTAPIVANAVAGVAMISDFALPKNLITDFGAKCDGVTNDRPIIAAVTFPVQVPLTPCLFSGEYTLLPDGLFGGYGPGEPGHLITLNGGNPFPRAPNMAVILTPPSYPANSAGSPETLFNGDMSHIIYMFQTYSGPGAIASPVSTANHIASHVTNALLGQCENAGGSQDPVKGRTGYHCFEIFNKVDATAGGDTSTYRCQGDIFSTTSNDVFPDEPAVLCYGGQVTAHADNEYLNPFEIHLMDGGNDDGAIAMVNNEVRTNGTAGNGHSWEGYDLQSQGSVAIDSAFAARGLIRIGLDLSTQNQNAPVVGQIAVAIRPDAYVYLGCLNSPPASPAGEGHFSNNTACVDTGIGYNSTSHNVEIHNAGHIFPFPSASPAIALFATTGNASPAPTGTPYLQVPCGTGSVNCSSGTLSITTGVNPNGNGEWLATITQYGSINNGSALTTESVSMCIAASPAPTVLDSSRFGTGAASNICRDTLTGLIAGGPGFGNSVAATSGLSQTIFAHIIIPNSTTESILCYVDTTTAAAATVPGFCSVKVDPY